MAAIELIQIASTALHGSLAPCEMEALVDSIDVGRLRSQLVALGICDPASTDLQITKFYFSGRCSALSPNGYFDETWYTSHYDDVRSAIANEGMLSGFIHFASAGLSEGRWPNSVLAAEALSCSSLGQQLSKIDRHTYLAMNPGAAAFIKAFPALTPLVHYNVYGRRLGYLTDRRRDERWSDDGFRVVRASFDREFYVETYLSDVDCDDPLTHYLSYGAKLGHSPNGWFDELWYCAFYPEVQSAIGEGWLPSGFFHYLHSGRMEGRQPRFDLTHALEARMPGVTAPALLHKAAEIEHRLYPKIGLPQLDTFRKGRPTVWIVFPTINPDIMFGGYRALLWLIVAILDAGFRVNGVCLEEEPNLRYFLLREGSEAIRQAFKLLVILGKKEFAAAKYSSDDRFLAYTAWDLPMCARLAATTQHPLPLLLTQEYEPVFYENGSHRAVCESLYKTPHFAIINSDLLRDYLADRRLGVFANPHEVGGPSRHIVFQHRIMQLPRQSASSMQSRSTRLLVLYARPEAHAARNVFEIAIIALQHLCADGFFGPEWRFEGVGALSKLPPLALGGGHEMFLREKQSESDYVQMCGEMDVGVSLMYAPHPSVMPFEFSTTGALVVTNTYDNRSAERLVSICGNIVPCDLSIEGVADAIRIAVRRTGDFEGRQTRAIKPPSTSWSDIFTPGFVFSILGSPHTSASGSDDRAPTIRKVLGSSRARRTVKDKIQA